MYALLMLLPQSEAFKTLHARLHSVPTVTLLKMDSQPPTQGASPKATRDATPRRSQECQPDNRCPSHSCIAAAQNGACAPGHVFTHDCLGYTVKSVLPCSQARLPLLFAGLGVS